MKKLLLTLMLITPSITFAGWHHGKIELLGIGYDGKTISIGQEGFTKTDCTCYPTWSNRYCLDRSRDSFKDEYALLLSAKARNKSVSIHINETSCKVTAIYEQ